MTKAVLLALILGATSPALADDGGIFDNHAAVTGAVVGDSAVVADRYDEVRIDADLARKLAEHSGATVVAVNENEALATAAAHGVKLEPWGHPWVIIKAGIGMPGNIQADIEIYVHRNWSVEAGAGTGLLGGWYTAAVHWHPDATTWNWFSVDPRTGEVIHENSFQLSWGAEVGFSPQSVGWGNRTAQIYITPNVEAAYIHRFFEHFGWTIGTRIGVGPAFVFDPQTPGPDLALSFLLYTGFVF